MLSKQGKWNLRSDNAYIVQEAKLKTGNNLITIAYQKQKKKLKAVSITLA